MSVRHFLLIFLLLASSLSAEEVALEDFLLLTSRLQTAMANRDDYSLNTSADELLTRISEVTSVRGGGRLFLVDMRWVANVGEAMTGEQAVSRRKLLFVNLLDTLSGLQQEFQSAYAENAVSRQEMKDALDRAIARTSEIRLSGDALLEPGLAMCGRSGIVAGQPGEAISLVSVVPSGETYSGRSGSGGVVSGSASGVRVSSGNSSGYSVGNAGSAGSSSGAGNSQGSGFSAVGSAVGGTGASRSTHGASGQVTGSAQSSTVSRPPVSSPSGSAGNQPVAAQPSAPAYSRPSTLPPPAKNLSLSDRHPAP